MSDIQVQLLGAISLAILAVQIVQARSLIRIRRRLRILLNK